MIVQVDEIAECAYIRLAEAAVSRTVNHNDEINIDLDEFSVVVGIEVLRLDAELPFSALVSDYHVGSRQVDLLRQIQPSIAGFVTQYVTAPSLHLDAQKTLTRC